MIVQSAASATNKKRVPKKPIYFFGFWRPTSSICFPMPVTTISKRFCQRERFKSVESLRVMSLEPTASTNINPQVNTIVPLSLKNPCCQKINWSGLRRMVNLLHLGVAVFNRCAGQPHYDDSRDDKSEQTGHQPLPISTPDKIKSSEHDAHPQHHAAEKPKRRRFGGNAFAHRPPKAAEKYCAE